MGIIERDLSIGTLGIVKDCGEAQTSLLCEHHSRLQRSGNSNRFPSGQICRLGRNATPLSNAYEKEQRLQTAFMDTGGGSNLR